jgi:hypothetical protein
MEYIEEYRDPGRIEHLVAHIRKIFRKLREFNAEEFVATLF